MTKTMTLAQAGLEVKRRTYMKTQDVVKAGEFTIIDAFSRNRKGKYKGVEVGFTVRLASKPNAEPVTFTLSMTEYRKQVMDLVKAGNEIGPLVLEFIKGKTEDDSDLWVFRDPNTPQNGAKKATAKKAGNKK